MMDRLDRETISSAVTFKTTDTGSLVLPCDKHGLPYEIWAIILSYLSAADLCRSSMVCKVWYEVVLSLDHTKWKDLYLKSTSWRHPYWPLNLNSEPRSWREAYKEQYIASGFWTQIERNQGTVTCMSVFKKTKLSKTITVGVGKEYESLKSALAVAHEYDRIEVYPGIYDEQFEMSSKIPFELIGCGELGSVILIVCIEQTSITGRISNLVFRAPWFTNFILKVRSGYLQVDNCIMEDGMVFVQNPGSVVMSFCTFRHATIILQHVNASIIQNCEFSQTDSAAITVEGYPKEEKNWTFRSLNNKIMSLCTLQKKTAPMSGPFKIPKSAFSLSTATTHVKNNAKLQDIQRRMSGDTEAMRRRFSQDLGTHDIEGHSCNMSVQSHCEGAVGGVDIQSLPRQRLSHGASDSIHSCANRDDLKQTHRSLDHEIKSNFSGTHIGTDLAKKYLTTHQQSTATDGNKTGTTVEPHLDKYKRIESFVSDCAKYSKPGSSRDSGDDNDDDECDDDNDIKLPKSLSEQPKLVEENHLCEILSANRKNIGKEEESDSECDGNHDNSTVRVPALDLHSLHSVRDPGEQNHDVEDNVQRNRSLSSSDVSVHTASSNDVSDEEDDGNGSFDSVTGSSCTSSSSDNMLMSDNDSEFSSSEESVIMLTYPDRHQPRSLSAQKDYADVASINSQNQSEHIDIKEDSDMKQVLSEVRGCFIHKCRITQSKGAVIVSLQAHAIVMECEINSVGYGIRCIQNSRSVILKNEIHHCRTSGVFMRLAASGLITGNDIHSNCEAGIDIRKNADPIVQCNRIHHGKRSGVVVLGSGRGQIRHNDIYQNKEAGVYILYRGNPTVCNNQIYSGRAAGIAVNEGGRGYIHDNVITGNQWGGIDIRHGGEPVIYHNTVCNGISDGIVIGEGGRATVENNIITGNAGCGVWVMAAIQPLIHGNEIYSNRDTGISLVNRMDTSHKNETMMSESKDTPSQQSLDFMGVATDDEKVPGYRTVSMATIEFNKVYHNEGKGISSQFGDSVLVQYNIIHGNKSDGIAVDQLYPSVVCNNSLTQNAGSGIMVSGHAKVEIIGNGIYDNRDHGIWCHNEASIIDNDILGNNYTALHIIKSNNTVVKENRIHARNDYCICLASTKSCLIDNNIFYTGTNDDRTIVKDEQSTCISNDNQILPVPECKPVGFVRRDQQSMMPLGSTRWVLTNPEPRPHVITPPQVSYTPKEHNVTTIARVSVPADTCEQGSKFCTIL